jgi:hypothetical protein
MPGMKPRRRGLDNVTDGDTSARSALEYLQRESHRLDATQRAILSRVEQTVFVAFTVMGVAATIVVADRHWAFALALPWLAALLIAINLAALNELFVVAANQGVIEDEIERLMLTLEPRIRVVGWQRGAGKLTAFSPAQAITVVIIVAGALAISIAAFWLSWDKLTGMHGVLVFAMVLYAFLLLSETFAANKVLRVYERARSLIEQTPDIQ